MPRKPTHNHMDQQRRPRGLCPACDVAWAVQEARLHNVTANTAERQIASLTERERVRWTQTFCRALADVPTFQRRTDGCETHTCVRPERHSGLHRCAVCDQEFR